MSTVLLKNHSYHIMKKILILHFGEIGHYAVSQHFIVGRGFRTILVQLPHCKMEETEAREMAMI